MNLLNIWLIVFYTVVLLVGFSLLATKFTFAYAHFISINFAFYWKIKDKTISLLDKFSSPKLNIPFFTAYRPCQSHILIVFPFLNQNF